MSYFVIVDLILLITVYTAEINYLVICCDVFFPTERGMQRPVNIFIAFPFVFPTDVVCNTGEELH